MSPPPALLPGKPRLATDEAELRARLSRHKSLATGLLAGMAGVTLGSYALPPGYWTDLLQASAKAGLVGGLADWFAVTALFRHPLGLPIPHTAIIPTQKARLGQGLGRFVANHVLTETEVRRVSGRIDAPALLRRFLSDPESVRPAAEALAASLPRILRSLEDGRARRLLLRLLPRMVSGPAAARMVARALRLLVQGGRHQEVFGLALTQIKVLVAAKQDSLKSAVAERVRAEGGALVGWVAGGAVARRVLSALNAELEKMEPGDSDLRAAFDAWVEAEIDRLENDPARAEAIGAALRGALAHPAVAAWLMDAWSRLRGALEADASRPEGRTVSLIAGTLANLGDLLEADPAARARVDRFIETTLLTVLPAAQGRISGFIAEVVAGWDTETVVDKIELRVGRDLQYVRINGTVVGALAGGVLFALLHAIFGRVAF
ncbi:DUF445 domain-containing protein [Pararoseomonas indoligenes]|uniref:DUF445 domain-containing protein n=1 Tax=Roseomonas indoligenes TaxID=2820811 RepID=A0A940MSE8_9PROT|nr:DUF445 domain-containing protein [Pararoseomonas indoligenes]MBP0492589.1 DUF445 domain-containing protein [Pararoseomonas indoligenes]